MARPASRAAEIRARIEADYVLPGTSARVLPSERALAQEYGAARATVRSALAQLTSSGLVHGVPGSGSLVLGPHLNKRTSLTSFTQDVAARGWTSS